MLPQKDMLTQKNIAQDIAINSKAEKSYVDSKNT